MTNQNRVCCLYRVSTGKQVDYTENHEADIPMQRKACHSFAEKMGWIIVHEEQEEGVSGHKVRAESRDKLQIIKAMAARGEFDIFLVFMFDRIGRIADETHFVVEWFCKHGIQVWSTQEGEQRFDNHTDKLLNYIRFWQADGESEKTSIRTRTSLGQLVEAGHFKGGFAAYGYDLVKSGRFNKKKHELLDLQINEEEAAVVRLIFDKYTSEGYGAQRIATYLNRLGYRTRAGKNWHPASIRGILCNPTYTGVLRSGDSRSDVLPELQIISPRQFETAQRIREERADHAREQPTVPLNTRGQSLLAGNVFCGHCGARLSLTTSGKYRRLRDGSMDKTPRIRYVCYGKTRKQTECDGPTGYTMHILDDIIDKMIRGIFRKMKGVSKNDLIQARYAKELNLRKSHMAAVKAELSKATETLNVLRAEIVRSIQGESAFSQDTLAGLIRDSEAKCSELRNQYEEAEAAVLSEEQLLNHLTSQYEELISWADLYDHATFEAKKMIVNCMIRRVEVFRDYKLNVEFNFDLNQFLNGLDISA
ncbi:MAG: recombinase family protein [Clostridiales bacterium]|nr:recombinase family protein [Clostridiales bacterium]